MLELELNDERFELLRERYAGKKIQACIEDYHLVNSMKDLDGCYCAAGALMTDEEIEEVSERFQKKIPLLEGQGPLGHAGILTLYQSGLIYTENISLLHKIQLIHDKSLGPVDFKNRFNQLMIENSLPYRL